MTAATDLLLFLAIAVGLPLYGIASWRRLVRRAAQGVEEARLESYTETMILEWALAAAVYPGYDSYQQFTERRIPVAVLERRAG